jgi:hypothetical protein
MSIRSAHDGDCRTSPVAHGPKATVATSPVEYSGRKQSVDPKHVAIAQQTAMSAMEASS